MLPINEHNQKMKDDLQIKSVKATGIIPEKVVCTPIFFRCLLPWWILLCCNVWDARASFPSPRTGQPPSWPPGMQYAGLSMVMGGKERGGKFLKGVGLELFRMAGCSEGSTTPG